MIAHMQDSVARYQVLDEKDRTARIAFGMATNGVYRSKTGNII